MTQERKPACSSNSVTLFSIIRSYNLHVWLQYGDNIRLSPRLWDLIFCEAFAEHCALWGPRFFTCSTSTSSMPAALLYLSVAIPFLYSSSLNDDTNEGIPSTVGSTGRIGFVALFLDLP